MPTKNSKKVMRQRKEAYDQISFLIDKGGRSLLHCLALREGIGISELIRRAILARGGLRMLPYPDVLKDLETITTEEEAKAAVYRMQAHENGSEIKQDVLDHLAPEPLSAEYKTRMDHSDISEFRYAVQKINAAIEKEKPSDDVFGDPVWVELNGREIGILRRLLSNIEIQKIQ